MKDFAKVYPSTLAEPARGYQKVSVLDFGFLSVDFRLRSEVFEPRNEENSNRGVGGEQREERG